MNPIKRWVKEFFELSHSQVNGFIVLVPLLLIILFSEPLWHWYVSTQPDDLTVDVARLDSLVGRWNEKRPGQREPGMEMPSKTGLFTFDPNRATVEELQTLGFSSNVSIRITRYREKGGKFRVKSDLLKIYGVDSAFYQQLYGYIGLPERISIKKQPWSNDGNRSTYKKIIEKTRVVFDLNQADTSKLKSVFGIGEKLSVRIVKYRDALGGFTSMEQLREIFGLDSVVVEGLRKVSFVAPDFTPIQLNINTLDEKKLSIHPYLRKTIARSIVAYRFQHGEFKTLDDLRSIHTLDEKTIEKILPYLTVGN